MLAITNDLERIGDVFYQMSIAINRKNDEKIWFTPEQRANVKHMLEEVDIAFDIMIANLKMDWNDVTLEDAQRQEKKINKLRNKYRLDHLAGVEKHEYNVKSGIVYSNLIYSSERVADHIMNVTEALIGENLIGE